MASPAVPTHGRLAAVYRRRPNGFVGIGLNDITWGTAYAGADSAYFEVEIDGEAVPDTFKWRVNGGAYTETVAITGAAQTLSDSQTILFAATTGHTDGDAWAAGNLKDEPCTESSATAQITDALMRILDPNNPPTFTDAGGATVLQTCYANGTAIFTANVGAVDVDGNLGYIPAAALEIVAYAFGWSLDFTLDMADASRMGQAWKEGVAGQAGFSGQFEAYLIGSRMGLEAITEAGSGDEYFLVKLFNYDPDADASGDHWICWASVTGMSVNAPVGDVVKEAVTFTGQGRPAFVANS